jgi:tetratricopeptide (TPR) repeat protein
MKKNEIMIVATSIMLILVVCVLTSCGNDFLSVQPQDELTNANFPQTINDLGKALIGAYAELQNGSAFEGNYTAAIEWVMPGDLYEQDQNPPRVQLELLSWPPNNTHITGIYVSSYAGISKSNLVIDEAKKIEAKTSDETSKKKLIVAQAKFLRGLFYYRLVKYFGGVPLITKELNTNSNFNIPRSSAKDSWKRVDNDLEDAAAVLPVSWPSDEAGRATKGAALGFLAKAYLWQKKYQKAIEADQKLINLHQYHLLSNFRDIFKLSNPDNAEIVFATQFSGKQNGIEGMNLDVRSAPRGFPSKYVGRDAWSNFVPRQEWIDAFTRDSNGRIKDKRYWAVIIGPGQKHQSIKGFTMPKNYPNSGTKTGYIITKWWQKPSSHNIGLEYPILRYAEVLLNYAEALNEVGQSKKAMKEVNIVRKRAGLDPKPLNLPKNKVLNEIFYEARMGFIWEPYGGFSMLNRRGRFLTFIKKHNPEYHKMDVADKPWLHQRPIRFPIPSSAFDRNPALKQNPGYPPFK